jgi:hypothetical protein
MSDWREQVTLATWDDGLAEEGSMTEDARPPILAGCIRVAAAWRDAAMSAAWWGLGLRSERAAS